VFAVLAAAVHAQQAGRLVAVMGITREIAPVEIRLEGATVTNLQGVVFTTGAVDGRRIIAVRSGVGKTNSAMAATLLLEHFNPSAVIWTGTAGAVDPDLNPADVVIGTSVGYHDYGVVTAAGFVRTPTRNAGTGQTDPAFFPANPTLLAAARRAGSGVKLSRGPNAETDPGPRIREGLIATGDAFVTDAARRNRFRAELRASAVEMEGASVAQVCARFGVPAIVIRSITDHADGDASGSYERFVDTASHNAAELALAIIQELQK
jgi:adenosylhomocysteine nucleosidase